MQHKNLIAIGYALLAAVFYAINAPFSKLLLLKISPTFMASFLYFGAGIGIGIVYLLKGKNATADKLSKGDLPFTVGMICLDILAPILLMLGLKSTTSANATLLNNFEIVATSLIALLVFKEAISHRLWVAIFLITLSSMILSFEDLSGLQFSFGSLLVLAAAMCWGLENNCTRMISSKSTYEIVILKGVFSGLGSFVIALIIGERLPQLPYIMAALLLGFVAYGLSIFLYVRAQNTLGAAKTSAYYAVAPFVGALLSLGLLHEPLTFNYFIAFAVMLAGSVLVVIDTQLFRHSHLHQHTITYISDGTTHTRTIEHTHEHPHLGVGRHHWHHFDSLKP